eukprot:NODE_5010_length_610_cov_96.853832_g4322_i0.p1 GENE.NODE_5010_length_610_cov_96.853832_g4322_i0~~NODE_5010_length_610_cov_96.853832_g4322_i0.p1  ORF type:complete len:147 (+),score=19.60 NODE_5010_length_610_cov_96.853832_g4322_i0:103-543(+)
MARGPKTFLFPTQTVATLISGFRMFNARVMLTDATYERAKYQFRCLPICTVWLPSGAPQGGEYMFDVYVGLNKVVKKKDDEWMYELQKNQLPGNVDHLEAFNYYKKSKFEACVNKLSDLENNVAVDCLKYVASKERFPVEVGLHCI